MSAGTIHVGAELGVAAAHGDIVLNRPGYCFCIISVSGNIGEAAHALRLRRAPRPPQESYNLSTSAGHVMAK